MTKARQTKRTRKSAPANLNRVPVTNEHPLDQCATWLVDCTQTKAFQSFLSCSLAYVQVEPAFHAKSKSGSFTPIEAKDGERIRAIGRIRVPSRATDAISAAGIDIQLVRRLMEGAADMVSKDFAPADKTRFKADLFKPNKELEKQAKEAVKTGADKLAIVKLKKANTDRLNAIAAKVLAQVGRSNPFGQPYVDLPDPATKTISCRVECTHCGDESEYSLRRIPLSEADVMKASEELPYCGVCTNADNFGPDQRMHFKGGAEALAKRAVDKFNEMAAELEGIEPELPAPTDSPKVVEEKVEQLEARRIAKELAEMFQA